MAGSSFFNPVNLVPELMIRIANYQFVLVKTFLRQPLWVALSKEQHKLLDTFGGNVRRLRSAAGLTQAKLAEKVELELRTIQKFEAGEINLPLTTLYRLRRTLGCSWGELLGEWFRFPLTTIGKPPTIQLGCRKSIGTAMTAVTKTSKKEAFDFWHLPAKIARNDFKYESLSSWAFNISVGCGHACRFCYVPSATTNELATRLKDYGVLDPEFY
jgi:transcriptional regulator with XRE-family HTH domain